jgi:hypothetical protein
VPAFQPVVSSPPPSEPDLRVPPQTPPSSTKRQSADWSACQRPANDGAADARKRQSGTRRQLLPVRPKRSHQSARRPAAPSGAKRSSRRGDCNSRNPAAHGGSRASAFAIWVLSDRTTPMATFQSRESNSRDGRRGFSSAADWTDSAYAKGDSAHRGASPASGDDQHVGAATCPLRALHRRRRRWRLARYVLVTSRVLIARPATARTWRRRSARRGHRPPPARRARRSALP